MRRILAVIVLLVVLVAAGGVIADTAYQAGVTAAQAGATTAQPLVVSPYGFGFGWHLFGLGFWFFGFLGTLLFLVLVFSLVRVVLFSGHHHRPWGRGGHWGGQPGARGGGRARAVFEDWHAAAHQGTPPADSPAPTGSPQVPPASPAA